MNDREKAVRAILTGRAGEYMVVAQLMLRGVNVATPVYDMGVDLIAIIDDNRLCRIQVKTARLSFYEDRYTNGIYFYPLLREKRHAVTNTRVEMRALPPFSASCDVVVLYGVDDNRFWIVPSRMLDGATGLGLGAPPKNKWTGDLGPMREMRSLGYTDYKIGKHYGLQATQIKQLLADPERAMVEETLASKVRQCENAWEHILNFGSAESSLGSTLNPETQQDRPVL